MNRHEFGAADKQGEKCNHRKATVSFRLKGEAWSDVHVETFEGNETIPLMQGGTMEMCPAMRADTFAAQVAMSGWTDKANEELGEIRHWMMHEISELKVHVFGSEEAS